MASISLGNFNIYNSSYGAFNAYLEYDSMSRSGNTLSITNARLKLNRSVTGYSTNRIACCVGYNGSTTNIKNNYTIKASGVQSGESYTVSLGTFSINTNGNFPFYVALKGTAASSNWSTTSGTPLTWNSAIAGIEPVPPSKPTGLYASPATPTPAGTITFGWNASSGGTNGVSGYVVDVKAGDGAWQNQKFYTTGTSVTTSGNALGAGHGVTIYFRVLSYSTVNSQNYYNTSDGTASCTVLVPPPTISTPTFVSKTQSQIRVSVSGSVGEGLSLSGYQFSKDNGATWTSTQASNEYTFTGLASNTAYNIKGKIVDSAGQTGTSSVLEVTTLPTVPVVNTPTTSEVTDTSVKVSVTGTAQGGIRGYQFSKDGGTTWTEESTTAYYTFSGLTAYTQYTFVAKIIDNVGQASTVSVLKRTLASKPVVSATELLVVTEEMFTLKATITVPSVSLSKIEYKLEDGEWLNGEVFNATLKTGKKSYIDLLEETVYNVYVRATNSENTVSDVLTVQVETLPGKFATLIREGQPPKKVHTYLVKYGEPIKKLTKRTFRIIKG